MHEPVPCHESTKARARVDSIPAKEDGELPPPPGDAGDTNEGELWARWRSQGDAHARETLIERHLPYARIVAARYYARRVHDEIEFGDYFQLASLAMVESVDRSLPGEGAQFRTFAARRHASGAATDAEQHYKRVEMTQLKTRLAGLVEGLPPAHRSVLQWHYQHDHNFVDIAQRLHLSRGRVSQIHRQALELLRQALAGGRSCDVAC